MKERNRDFLTVMAIVVAFAFAAGVYQPAAAQTDLQRVDAGEVLEKPAQAPGVTPSAIVDDNVPFGQATVKDPNMVDRKFPLLEVAVCGQDPTGWRVRVLQRIAGCN